MALSKDKKKHVVDEVNQLLSSSKLTVFAHYPGTTVKDMQQLRRQASENDTTVRVIKNRLFKKALASSETFKEIDGSGLQGQLLYAFNSQDETAPAQSLAKFSSSVSPLEFVGGLTSSGDLLSAEDVQILADLPTKQQLRGQLASMLVAPVNSFVSVVNSNIRALVSVMDARARSLGQ